MFDPLFFIYYYSVHRYLVSLSLPPERVGIEAGGEILRWPDTLVAAFFTAISQTRTIVFFPFILFLVLLFSSWFVHPCRVSHSPRRTILPEARVKIEACWLWSQSGGSHRRVFHGVGDIAVASAAAAKRCWLKKKRRRPGRARDCDGAFTWLLT